MNFKPNWLKSVVSLLIGVIVNYILFKPGVDGMICPDGIGSECYIQEVLWIDHVLDPMSIIFTLIVIALVYIIWSLIEKKKS